MRKFTDFHETKWALVPSSTCSPSPTLLLTTSISAYGYGRAKFTFLLGQGGTGATFTSGLIMMATASGAAYSSVTAVQACIAGALGSSILEYDIPIVANSAGTAYSWLLVSSASVVVSSWPVMAIVDLYNCYIHPPVSSAQMNVVVVM
jgi:hypothetical protein